MIVSKRFLLVVSTLLLACLNGWAKKGDVTKLLPKKGCMIENVTYKVTPQGKQRLDIYLPDSTNRENIPVIVFIHGGSWVHGSKDAITSRFGGEMLKNILKQGYALISINYRLANDSNTVAYPGPLADCKDAVKWTKAHAQKYHFDVTRMAVMGSSAGGHLAMLTAYAPDDLAPGDEALSKYDSKVNCVVDIYGPTNLGKILRAGLAKPAVAVARMFFSKSLLSQRKVLLQAFTGEGDGHPHKRSKKCWAYSPLKYVDSAVPTITFHGDKDTLVPFKHTTWLEKSMKKAGKTIEVHPIAGENHSFPTITPEATQQMCNQLVEFLGKYLK